MFRQGDIIKVVPEWRNQGEDPNLEHFVLEDYGNGKVKTCRYNEHGGYASVEDMAYYMIQKVGHVDWKKRMYKEGDLLADDTDRYYLIVDEVEPRYNKYRLVAVAPDGIKGEFFNMHITELADQGYRFVKSLAGEGQ